MNKIDIINRGTPIPDRYTQYPGGLTPSEIYGGIWELIFSDSGVFFRTEGADALPFESGVQEENVGAHTHYSFSYSTSRFDGHLNGDRVAATTGAHKNDVGYQISPSNGTPNTGLTSSPLGENRPVNITIRVWSNISK